MTGRNTRVGRFPQSAHDARGRRLLLTRDSFSLVWASGRREFLLTSAIQLVAAAAGGVQLLVAQRALGAVIDGPSLRRIIPWLLVIGATDALFQALRIIEREKSQLLGELVSRRAMGRLLSAATAAELILFEDSEFHDRLRRAQAQGQYRGLQLVRGLLGMFGGLIAAVGVGVALASMQPFLVPFLLLGAVPLAVSSRLNSRDSYGFAFSLTTNDRQRGYLQQLMTGRDEAKEVRAFNLGRFLRRSYDDLYDERILEFRKLARRRITRTLLGECSTYFFGAISLVGLAWLYSSHRLPLASAGAAVYGFSRFGSRLQGVMTSGNSLYEATLFLRDYQRFVESCPPDAARVPRVTVAPLSLLVVDNVMFSYPDASTIALSNVSLEIRPGEIVALVGENGSGKTTLAKIVAGLYQPTSGHVFWNGVDTATLDREKLREQIAVIFQDFARYRFTARQNIGVGRSDLVDDLPKIEMAAIQANADRFIHSLASQYDTMLGREFPGGQDLSLGQWQRIALSRALFRDATFVILDEPTAALDARAEAELFEHIRRLLVGRSILLVSHRFSTVRSATRIHLLEHGRITETGRHDELMEADGAYAALFRLQADGLGLSDRQAVSS